jgi:GlpG protein
MRKLAHFDSAPSARRLADALYGLGIANELRSEEPNGHTLWVLEERRLADARALLERFHADPDDPQIQEAAREAGARRKTEQQSVKRARDQVIDVRTTFRRSPPRGPVTSGLILISVLVMMVSYLRPEPPLLRSLLSIAALNFHEGRVEWLPFFADVRAGQVWRLVTPIFLHGDFLHLLFNMWWLLDLGSQLEHRIGSLQLLALVLLSAALSNAAQLQWGGNPLFGGMSGVVYALFGYLWIRGKLDPSFGIALRPQLAGFFLIWLALGISGVLDSVVGPVANYCHSGGLAVGAGWGYLASLRRPRTRPP